MSVPIPYERQLEKNILALLLGNADGEPSEVCTPYACLSNLN